ncbi:MAG: trypsin-like serine protease [Polyangiales bacterium]
MKLFSTAMSLVASLCAIGCGLDSDDAEATDQAEPAVLPIYGGTPAPGIGVVAITMQDGYECSGVVISPRAVLTAAHCLRSSKIGAGQTAEVQASVVFTKADGRLVCLTGPEPVRTHAPRGPQCTYKATYTASVHPKFTGSQDGHTDIAIMVRNDGRFTDLSTSEIALIQLNKPSGDRLEFHGYGYENDQRTVGGRALSSSAPVNEIYDDAVSLDLKGGRTCVGDSGGPMTEMFADTSPNMLVVGITAWTRDEFNGCPGNNKEAYFGRVGTKLAYIEQKLGHTCDRVKVRFGNGTRDAARCLGLANVPDRQR